MTPRTNNSPTDAPDFASDDHAWESRLDRAASSLYADAVPPTSLKERVSAAVVVPATFSPRRRVLLWSGVTVSACAAAASAVLVLSPGAPINPIPAFAQVEAAMSSIKTAHWTETASNYYRGERTVLGADENWLRSDPPAFSNTHTYSKSELRGYPAFRSKNVHLVWDTNGMRIYDGMRNVYSHDPTWPGKTRAPSVEALRRLILSVVIVPASFTPQANDETDLRDNAAGFFAATRVDRKWQASRVMLRGRPALLFEQMRTVTGGTQTDPDGKNPRPIPANMRTRVWADADTRRVVRREVRQRYEGTTLHDIMMVATNFRYDEEPPPGTFEVTPPADAKINYGKLNELAKEERTKAKPEQTDRP